MSKRKPMRRVALETDSGTVVYAHINDETKPETIDALKAIGDAIGRMTNGELDALLAKQRELR